MHKPIILSNGQVIPAGCIIEVAAYNSMHDPDFISDPMEFDALRWYRQRQTEDLKGAEKASADSANQMVTVSPTALTFGYGRHACPGRFFAANEIKMIMGHAILDYDFKNADGSMERYPNLRMSESVSRILFEFCCWEILVYETMLTHFASLEYAGSHQRAVIQEGSSIGRTCGIELTNRFVFQHFTVGPIPLPDCVTVHKQQSAGRHQNRRYF